jgi:hypothetical protein
LGETVIFSVKYLPVHLVSGRPETDKLIAQQVVVLREPHPVHILDDKRQWPYLPQNTVVLAVEEIDFVRVVSAAPLTVPLARIATGQDVSFGESLHLSNVAGVHDSKTSNAVVQLARGLALLVCPDGFDAGGAEADVAASAAREQRDC